MKYSRSLSSLFKTIISDAGPLIAFGRIDRLSVLFQLFKTVMIPKKVANECTFDLSRPGASNIKRAITTGKIKISTKTMEGEFNELIDILGEGEASAIKLALINKSILLIDGKSGRRAAKKLHVKIIGTAGILLLAKKQEIIHEVWPVISELKRCGYRLSQSLIDEVMKLAKEAYPKSLSNSGST
jgi:predicted nucleic acid-binding protein